MVKFLCLQGLSAVVAEIMVFWLITPCRIMSLFGLVVHMGSGPESVSPFLQMMWCVCLKRRNKLIILKAGLAVSVPLSQLALLLA
jgi:hypothetical protein